MTSVPVVGSVSIKLGGSLANRGNPKWSRSRCRGVANMSQRYPAEVIARRVTSSRRGASGEVDHARS